MRRIFLMVIAALAMSLTASAAYLLEYTGSDPCDPGSAFSQAHNYTVYTVMPNGSPGLMIGWYRIDCNGVGAFAPNTTRIIPEARGFDRLMRSELGRGYTNTLQQAYNTFGEGVSLRALTEEEAAIRNARAEPVPPSIK